jgi:hypothetical protein
MYILVDPPIRTEFAAMTKKELEEYKEWFFQVKQERLDILINASCLNPKIMFTVDSLQYLGEWLVKEVGEMKQKDDFTGLLSRGFDIGVYLGEFIINNHQGAYWIQSEDKSNFNFGKVVIRDFLTYDYDVYLVAYNMTFAVQEGSRGENVFSELYNNLQKIPRRAITRCFDYEFSKSNGKPIKYKDWELIAIDRIPVQKNFSGTLKIISTYSEWKQAVCLGSEKGKLVIGSKKEKKFVVYEDDIDDDVLHFEGTSKGLQLIVHNAWEQFDHRNTPFLNYWVGNAAMILEIDGNTRRYRCNDSHPDDNFDDIIFEITIDD